jgi:hypothetical protein
MVTTIQRRFMNRRAYGEDMSVIPNNFNIREVIDTSDHILTGVDSHVQMSSISIIFKVARMEVKSDTH